MTRRRVLIAALVVGALALTTLAAHHAITNLLRSLP